MRHEGEPSVEEILESIKKVIARDNRETLEAERRRRESAGMMLETLIDEEDGEEEGSEEDGDILDLGEAGEVVAPPARREPASGLTTETSARAMRDSLAALAMIAEPGASPQIVRSGETSLEGLVREMLRPMLAEWLDRNLPEMVERLVKAEIARIAGKKG